MILQTIADQFYSTMSNLLLAVLLAVILGAIVGLLLRFR
jgi:hypothetical protein